MALPGTGTVQMPTSNQIGLMLFDGVVGQRVSVATSGTFTGGCGGFAGLFQVSILNPDGSTLAPPQGFCGGSFFDVSTLPATATYTILVTSSGPTGSVGLTLYNVPPDITDTITIGGPSVTLTIPPTAPGQNARLTFSGTQNQRVSLLWSVTFPPGVGCGGFAGLFKVSILKPDGLALVPPRGTCSADFFDVMTLPAPGSATYTIFIDPDNALTGSITLTLYNVPPDITDTITIGGPSVTVTIAPTAPGQNARLTFSGTQNQRVSVGVSVLRDGACGGFAGQFWVSILNPDGSTLVSPRGTCSTDSFSVVLPVPGTPTYTIFIDPENALTGRVTVTLTSS